MQSLDPTYLKHSYTTNVVPLREMGGLAPLAHEPCIGDLVVVEVLRLGQHNKLENRDGAIINLFPGDQFIGAFGNRYATDQYEGYVPKHLVEECDMLSVGGVLGEVASKHTVMNTPTRVRVLGAVCDRDGRPLSLNTFGLAPRVREGGAEVILIIGASMNSGKTTTAGMVARALRLAGKRVAAAKATGTAAGKDGRFIASCGAFPVFDFVDAGYPSTYMLSLDELLAIYRTLLAHLSATKPDYIVVEVADGIFQRETRMLLDLAAFVETVDHIFFAANDSLSAECGVRWLRERRLPVRATSGVVTQSQLAMLESEIATGLPCLSNERMVAGEVVELLRNVPRAQVGSMVAQASGQLRQQTERHVA